MPTRIERWGEIAAHVTARVGIPISIDSVKRFANRAGDPLPATRWSTRVIVDVDALNAWIDRQGGSLKPTPPP